MHNEPPPVRIRDLAPTAVRLAPEVREQLAKEAAINGRSLHAEIVHRLKESLHPGGGPGRAQRYSLMDSGVHYGPEQTDPERAMLALFKRLPPAKQLALLSLFE